MGTLAGTGAEVAAGPLAFFGFRKRKSENMGLGIVPKTRFRQQDFLRNNSDYSHSCGSLTQMAVTI